MKKGLILAALTICSALSIANAKTVKIGTEATFAPFEFTNEKSEIIGFDIDIIKAIAAEEGFDVEIVNMPFDALVPSVLTSQLEGAIAGVTITEERAQRVSFSDPYYKSGISAVIRKEDVSKYPTIDSLKSSRLCAQIGTTGANAAQKISGNFGSYNTVPEAIMELKTKGCEAVVNDRPVNLYFLRTQNDDSVVEIKELLNGEDYGIMVSKKNPELLKQINDGLDKIRKNGKFAEIHKKWFNVEE
ncbi:polar amino acid transport system substrate-binding protein [Succinivibrio dextrinosolvens]|uniref:basic amino acid ABC transporter substrate-binding protein n=1 Tax=Succinivibrio dextrinosolvens TaxID=83771 RepID=UPI0008E101D8|nr:basic amino acid ABC transporter substrate-binding protein [Succinivibrio dextrinosolvens]SFS82607.1 polar amino acid transport system substrate-binding protein [Succinivibrio dextrinosolvens]